MNAILLPAIGLLLSLTVTTPAQERSELGRMWTFENPPLDYLHEEYGFRPDQEWLDSLRLGTLRLGGEEALARFGSASFVSPEGLIMTSGRCVRSAVAWTRPRAINLIRDGFYAASLEKEMRLRTFRDGWLSAAQLVEIAEVTEEVDRGVLPTDDEVRIREKRRDNRQAILAAARKADPDLVPQIVGLHQGAVFRLYRYRVYRDLRLVILPHLQAAHFGGDRDRFTYPRYSLDFAFLRAYEDGKPADTKKHHFRWKPGGAKREELVFASGNPGTTKRRFTMAQMELERDLRIPMEIERHISQLRIAKDPRSNTYDGEFDPENPSKHWAWVRTGILQTEDELKRARGHLRGLRDPELMARKSEGEEAFKRRVMADERLAEKYGDLWSQIAGVVQVRRRHEARARFQIGPGLLAIAVDLVRSCDPADTAERRKKARKDLEAWAGSTVNFNFHGIAAVRDELVRARTWLSEDDPFFVKVLGGRGTEEFMALLAPPQSQRPRDWFGFPEPRDALVTAGWKAIQESEDPVIAAARELVPLMRENEKLGDELDAKEEALGAELGRALLAIYGAKVSSDGTGTPRFTGGVVRGHPFNGTIAPHRTAFYGLYSRSTEFANEYPFKLPEIWRDREDEIDLTKAVTFVSTNDISRGAGSVIVNRALEVVGVVVDGNIESLGNDFVFRDDVPRSVSVHVEGILEALVKIYGAHRIAAELAGN